MSHNIHNANKGNDASVFTVREAPWHKLGTVFAKPPTVIEALKAMGSPEVVKEACKHPRTGEILPGHFWTIRTDSDVVLGHVGNIYRVVSAEEGFALLKLIGGEIEIAAGGVLGQGEKIFLCCKLPGTTKLIGGDTVDQYFVLVNSYDGSTPVLLCITPIRTVCQNTVNAALKAALRRTEIRHTTNYENRAGEAARVLGVVKNYYSTLPEILNGLINIKHTRKDFIVMTDELIGKPKKDATPRQKSMYERQHDLLMTAYDLPDLANYPDTGYKSYNAVVDYADHARIAKGKDEARKAANKFMRTFTDNGSEMKDRAFELIVARK